MKKSAKRKPKSKPAAKKRAVKRKAEAVKSSKTAIAPDAGKLTFNHAMIYSKDVERGVRFYRDLLGFKLIEDFSFETKPVYARLRAPGGDGTIALHQAAPGSNFTGEGVRLYFEVRDLDEFCRKLQKQHFFITQLPRMMPWGWRHAYLNDPDGHEISLYWAGENRMKKSVLKAVRRVQSS